MLLELAMAGMLSCTVSATEIEGEDLLCYYVCQDTSTEFARTNKAYSCPKRIYVDREPIPWRDRQQNRR